MRKKEVLVMKRIVILALTAALLCGILCGCTPSGKEKLDPSVKPVPVIPNQTRPRPTVPIETIPRPTDDADYHLPPGERPTVVPEIK